jgi:hypothetical protein
MHKNQNHILALSLSVAFLFVGTHFGGTMCAEKWGCFQNITLSIYIDTKNYEPELLFGVGPPPGGYQAAPLVPAQFLRKSFKSKICSHATHKGLKSRAPPTLLYA